MKNLKDVRLYLFDMDGTIYCEDKLIDGAVEKINEIRASGRKICFLTNNSSRNCDDYVTKLARLGIAIDLDEIYTSGNATVKYLNKHYSGKSVYLVGTDKLREQFLQGGIRLVDDCQPDLVVVGFDTTLTYEKLRRATTYLTLGATYICTHPDVNCPASPVYMPDVGSFMALIEKSCGRTPDVICGKPFKPMGEAIAEKFHLSSRQIAMVGDRLITDIQFGINNDFTSILVYSGETTRADYAKWGKTADFTLDSVKDIDIES